MNIAIITGASSGIGREFALQMDEAFPEIDEFWLLARRRDKLMELKNRLKHKCLIFGMDVTRDAQLDLLTDIVKEQKANVAMLINCAGYGIMGSFADQDLDGQLGMIRVNCEALTNMTHKMLPHMSAGSRIIQMASSAAFLPQPDFAVYAATKSYVLSFSRALNEELRGRGISVTAVCPGPVETPFFDIAERDGHTLAIKKYTMVRPERVVKQALSDSDARKAMSVCSLPIKGFHVLTKAVPHSLILKVMNKMKKD